jgi:hypothetical protein
MRAVATSPTIALGRFRKSEGDAGDLRRTAAFTLALADGGNHS